MPNALMSTYAPLPVAFVKGQGAWLWDQQGRKFLDGVAGVATCNLGHAHPAVTEAVCHQAGQLVHTSNHYQITLQQALAEELTRLSGMEKTFFCNSGAEANETAIKLARLYGHNKGIADPVVVVTENSFHGRTLATLSATGNRRIQAGFEPLVHGFVRVPFDDLEALHNVARNSSNVVAVLVEPVQGEGGVNVPGHDYLDGIRALCNDNGWLMMLDEIQTGMCRTGEWFGFQHTNDMPDVITLAKGLGNGVPIGACLARGAAAQVFQAGNHGSTFGGNPLACSAALAVVKTMRQEKLAARASALGTRIRQRLTAALAGVEGVHDIRGLGMLIGIELDRPCKELMSEALENGLLVNVTADKVIRLMPPLIMSEQEADQLVDILAPLVEGFLAR